MKAVECSERAVELVSLLEVKLNSQDQSPLCQLLATYMAKVVSTAKYGDCLDETEIAEVVEALDLAYRAWIQYEHSRGKPSP